MSLSRRGVKSKIDEIKFALDCAYLGLGDVNQIKVDNPFHKRTKSDVENPHKYLLRLMRKPENLWFTNKHIFNIDLAPFQIVVIQNLWKHKFPLLVAARGFSKSFLAALYLMNKTLFTPHLKAVVVGAAFRQSKVIHDYCETIWRGAPVLRSLVGDEKGQGPSRDVDRCTVRLGESQIISLPIGTGEKIRGQRGGIVLVEEFDSVPEEIFEVVIKGFGVVSTDPVERMKQFARIRMLRDQGLWTEEHQNVFETLNIGNQTIISGTAGYGFKHFAKYWRRYKSIIETKGDKKRLLEIGESEHLNWKDFCVIRVPYDMIPEGFMDEKTIAHSQATMHSGLFQMEMGCIFIEDSNGFFKRSLIESCVTNYPIDLPSGSIQFHPRLSGDRKLRYVIAIDPASEADKFSIVIIEIHGDHRRIVYCWTTTRQEHRQKVNQGVISEENFYAYAARKIRELMKIFPYERVVMDSQGGGYQVYEALHDKDKLAEGEQLIWEVTDPDDPKDTDHKQGLHILELVYFADYEYTREANHGLRKDMEDKILLFPMFDPLSLAFAAEEDGKAKRNYDTLEDCVMEIEELKNELTTIVVTQTQFNNREHWDTPEIKQAGGRKGRLRKDRYTALLMANATARKIHRADPVEIYTPVGGFVGQVDTNIGGNLYTGCEWANGLDSSMFISVQR